VSRVLESEGKLRLIYNGHSVGGHPSKEWFAKGAD
jgi:hypothetical protein